MKTAIALTEFAQDVLAGLILPQKRLSSKYFYDDHGSAIFRKIMTMPEYYPTRCEHEILRRQAEPILKQLDFSGKFNVVELGCGDGSKTIDLLRGFIDCNAQFVYLPVDISPEAISVLEGNVKKTLPELTMRPVAGDYFKVLDRLARESAPSLFLFLGGNIGNYSHSEAENLLVEFQKRMHHGDKILVGMDLKKNPRIIQKAYDDPHGITKAFNMNLLRRMNVELEMDFHMEKFDFYCCYDPEIGEVNSYLVSLADQTVFSRILDTSFVFSNGECIWTELSKKYTEREITTLARASGFSVVENFHDSKNYFTDSLWVK
ncbi:MAG: hypothetical protein EOO51_06845 [Flavobacterium sp.]|nr:MAG: hypothetical protein EOO51_06845 [Flavobacterium sp.]